MKRGSGLREAPRFPVWIALFLVVLTLNAVCTDLAPPSSTAVTLQEFATWRVPNLNVSGGLIKGDTVFYWSLSGEAGLLEARRAPRRDLQGEQLAVCWRKMGRARNRVACAQPAHRVVIPKCRRVRKRNPADVPS
jgi:hypothetical protein